MGSLKAIATIATMLVVLIVLAIGGAIWWSNHSAKALVVKEQTVAAKAVVGQGQAQAAQQAQQIVVSGEARNHLDIQVHQENAHAIAEAPGASDALDPGLVATVNRGLCRYTAERADPVCLKLRGPDPAIVPPAGADPGGAPY